MGSGKFGLGVRLMAAMTGLVILTAATVAFLAYRNVENAVLPRALDRYDMQTQLLATRLATSVEIARSDVQIYSKATAVDELVRALQSTDPKVRAEIAQLRAGIEDRFMVSLTTKPFYFQYRLIGVANNGREIIHVHRRADGTPVALPEAQMQWRGDREFFKAATGLRPGEVYVSPVTLARREGGELRVPHVPIFRVAAPIMAPDGNLFALVVLDVDLRSGLAQIRSETRVSGSVFVTNESGDYLLHPDPQKEFGWLLGRPRRLQDDFPALQAALTENEPASRVVHDSNGARFALGLAKVQLAGGPAIAVLEAVPYSAILALADTVRQSSVMAGIFAALVAVLLGALVASSMTRPLAKMTRAIEQFAPGSRVDVPTESSGEIGTLARAFARMADDVSAKTAEVRRNTELVEKIIAVMGEAVLVVDRGGKTVYANPACKAMFGDRDDVGSPEWQKSYLRYRPDGVTPFPPGETPIGRAMRGENFDNLEIIMRRVGNPRPTYIVASGRVIRTAEGVQDLAVIVYRDVTAITEQTAALIKETEERRRMFESSLDLIMVVDPKGRIVRVSPSATAILGFTPEEMAGRSAADFMEDDELERTREEMREGRRGRQTRNFEAAFRHQDGHVVPLVWNGVWSEPEQKHFFVGRDMSERVRLEQQLRQSQKMDAVGQLVGGVAHDFNNILTVITGTIEILAEGVADRPQLSTIARMIDGAARRGADLTKQLLAFARRQPLQPREVDVNTLVVEAARLLRTTLGEEVAVESMLAPDLWPALVDPTQLSTALINLAVNARDAMPEGGMLTLETRNSILDEDYARAQSDVAPGDYVRVAVSDTGTGIPPELRDKVFEPFFTTKDVGKGTGLGLSMVYGFVKQSGGHIRIYSEVGHGTTITLYLPRAQVEALPEIGTAPAEPPRGNEIVLVVEDDAMVRTYVVTLLRSLGYRTVEADSGAAALALIDGGLEFDLLFTDVIMPGGMNGRELADAALKRRPGLKVLFTSGYAENALVHHGRVDAGVALLNKPYRKIDLATRVRALLDDAAIANETNR